MKKGKIIVVEGACDGVGKTTQYELLEKALVARGEDVVKHHFPSYGVYQGAGVEEYLSGGFGDIKNLSPYFINCLYANDRAVTWYKKLKREYEQGKTILLDRYTTSSLIYQAALMENVEEKMDFIDFVCDFEYGKLGIGKPDKVIFLCAPFELVTKMRNAREENDGVNNDLHEKDLLFMKRVYDNAVFLADYLKWDIVKCDKDDGMRSIGDIHRDICEKV